MANLLSENDIILGRVEGALIEAKDELSIDYSKIKCFAQAFKEATKAEFQISRFKAEPFMLEACRKCNINSGRDAIKKVLRINN